MAFTVAFSWNNSTYSGLVIRQRMKVKNALEQLVKLLAIDSQVT